jgi:membrane protein
MLRWLRKRLWDEPREAWDRFQQDDGSLMAAATSFYAGLSLMPLLIVIVSGVGLVLESTRFGADAQQQVLSAIEADGSPLVRQQVETLLSPVAQGALVGGPLGRGGLLLGAIAIFAQFERAFDRIWNVDSHRNAGFLKSLKYVLIERFRAFLMLGSLGLLVLAIFLAGLTVTAVEQFASRWWPVPPVLRKFTEWGVSLTLNAVMFTLLYRLIPKVEVRWREAFAGAALVAVGWELGRYGLSAVLVRSPYLSAYGTIGSLLAILLWIYFATHLLFLGAEYIQVICRRCD